MSSILIGEDDPAIREGLEAALQSDGHEMRAFRAGDADLVRETAGALLRDPPLPLDASEADLLAWRLDDAWLATAATNAPQSFIPNSSP